MVQQVHQTTQESHRSFAFGKVLIVDEDTRDLDSQAELFEARGFTVSKCELYDKAIRSIEREKFDLVVADQGPSTLEAQLVLRYLNQCQPSTPCIVMSRSTDVNCYLRVMELGAVEYLEKPLSLRDVNRILQNHLGVRPSGLIPR
jgi:DNA-binding NtrC family response regulator